MKRPALLLMVALLACHAHSTPPPPTETGPREGTAADAWWNGAVFYEVFVRSYQDSNGDGIGDLQGLIARLDYLRDAQPGAGDDLEVDAIWLMPVFESPSYHGYDTVDYDTIERDYGTNADFDRLIAEAHARGLKVIVDLVLNHTSDQHPWFVDSASSSGAAHRDWYVWSNTDLGWRQPWNPSSSSTWHFRNRAYYYAVFWERMPDLNYRAAAVRDEVKRIAASWLQRGVDGFRLDAVRYLIESGAGSGQADTDDTLAFWKEFYAYVRGIKPDVALVGEAWSDTPVIARYYGSTSAVAGGDVLPMNFDFPLSTVVLSSLQGSGNAAPIAAKLSEVSNTYPLGAADAPFLTNHDQNRIASEPGVTAAALANAAAILLTVPGSPFIYYGEELGAQNGPSGADEQKRLPMAWDSTASGGFTTASAPWSQGFGSGGYAPNRATANVAAGSADAGSLLSRYRRLIRARHGSPALTRGDLRLLTPTGGTSATLAFVRTGGGEQVLVVHNVTDAAVSAGPFEVTGTAADAVFADSGATATAGASGWTIALPARGSGIWRIR